MSDRNLNQDLKVDKHLLDDHWEDQAEKYHYYSQAAMEAQEYRDRLKFNFEVLEAQVEREIRQNPTKFGILDKVTEGAIKSALLLEQKIQDARSALLDADKEVNLTKIAMATIGDMKKTLENLTSLYLSNYWAEPRMPKQIQDNVGATVAGEQREALTQSPRLARRG